MAEKLSDLIETAAGFRAAVNIVQEQDDAEKAAAFLPTEKAAEVLFDLGRQLEPRANERARLITGTYGTGKSHLALVVTRLYRGQHEAVAPVLSRMAQRYPGQAEVLENQVTSISAETPYLVVLIEGDQDSFDAALVRGLRQALDRAGMGDYMPPTYFSAAADRLGELLEEKEAASRAEEAARDEGFDSATALIERLNSPGVELQDLEKFRRLHERVCFGAPFLADTRLNAPETYRDAVRELVEAGRFAGIVVIWDEFGAFMDQIVREPGSGEGLAVQRFAEACQDSGEHALHVYLIAHRHLASYIRRVKDTMHLTQSQTAEWEQDFRKVSGRFREFMMESEPEELYALVDDVLIQKVTDGWTQFRNDRDSDFEILAETAYGAGLFPDLAFTRLRQTVVEGCYPLAPATAAFLPRIAELVAQNQRTLFTFLCGDHPGSVAQFLRQTRIPEPDQRLPLVPCDHLWDYFEQAIREDRVGQGVYRRYRAAIANSSLEPDDEFGRRLLKVMALFDVVREGDPERAAELPAREEQLGLALDLRSEDERQEMAQRLEELSRVGPSRVAVCSRDGVYHLISGTGTELREAVEQLLEQRRPSLNVAAFLRKRWGKGGRSETEFRLGFEEAIEALTHRTDVVSRTLKVAVVLAEEIDNLNPWLKNIGGGEFMDGLVFLVLPTEDPHVGAISKRALALADNPQTIVVRPPHSLQGLREVVARVDALEQAARQESRLWGPQGERRDEWEAEYQDAVGQLTEILQPVALRQNARDLHVDCFWQGSPRSCHAWSELQAVADEAMAAAFAKTPHTNDDIMKPAKRDGLAAARRTVVDKLLDARGPELLLREKDQAQGRLVRLLQGFDMLKAIPKPHLDRPDPDVDAGAAAIWDYLQEFGESLRDAPQDAETPIGVLRAAPYGLGERVVPLVLAAALREPMRSGNIVAERSGRGGEWQGQAIDGETLDDVLIGRPGNYRFRYVDVTPPQIYAVEGLISAIAGEEAIPEGRQRLFEEAKNQVTLWWSRLAHYSQQTETVSDRARRLRDQILRPLVHPNADAHSLLVDELWERLGDAQQFDRTQFTAAFADLIGEIEQAVAELPKRVSDELREGLELECDAEPEAVVEAIRAWYAGCSEEARQYCHPHDAGKLQAWLRDESGDLPSLCASIMGRPLGDWGDRDVGHLVGRVQAARQAIEEWTPPPGPLPAAAVEHVPEPLPGQARLSVSANFQAGPLKITRQFPTIEPDELTETAKIILRLLNTNLADDQSLLDGERENILLQLIRRVFGDG